MMKLIPISMFLLATPFALALLAAKKGPEVNYTRNGKVLPESESMFIGS